MKAYQVQFILPCEQPLNNIRRIIRKGVVHFEVPINTPDLQSLGYEFLAANAKDEVPVEPKVVRKLNKS